MRSRKGGRIVVSTTPQGVWERIQADDPWGDEPCPHTPGAWDMSLEDFGRAYGMDPEGMDAERVYEIQVHVDLPPTAAQPDRRPPTGCGT